MGIKLMVEVLDHWQDAGLTAGERADLLVIAENANDATRETFPKGGMHQEYVLKRVGKTAAAWKNAIGKLMRKGVISYAVRDGRELCGFPGQVAVYRIAAMCPEAPHDGLHGQCTRSERVTSQVTQSETGDAMGHLSGDPNPGMGHLSDAEWVTSQVTPSPPTPSYQPPSPAQLAAAAEVSGREGGGIASLEEQAAYRTLARIASKDPRLTLGEAELADLAPLVAQWLQRAPADTLTAALTAGLPAAIGNPAGLLRARIVQKMPPQPVLDEGEDRCGRPNCDPITHMLTLPDHSLDFCPTCHPTGRARARRNHGAAA